MQAQLSSTPHLPWKMNSYLKSIRNSSSVIGRAPILLQALPYSNSPHPSLLPCLPGIPVLSSTTLPPPSPPFFSRSSSSTWLHPPLPTMHCWCCLPWMWRGSVWREGGGMGVSFMLQTSVAPPADSLCCGSIWIWSPWQQWWA